MLNELKGNANMARGEPVVGADKEPARPSPIDVHVGSRIRLRRTLLGMSQERLGEADRGGRVARALVASRGQAVREHCAHDSITRAPADSISTIHSSS